MATPCCGRVPQPPATRSRSRAVLPPQGADAAVNAFFTAGAEPLFASTHLCDAHTDRLTDGRLRVAARPRIALVEVARC